MSEIRRKLLLNSKNSEDSWEEISRFISAGNYQLNIPENYSELGFFIVGGGGSGHGDFSNAGNPGNGGNGGCVNYFIIPFSTNFCSITVGAGGAQAPSRGNSNNGKSSSVTYDGTTYSSAGGYGGYNTKSTINTIQTNSGIGGFGIFTAPSPRYSAEELNRLMEYCNTHLATDYNPVVLSPSRTVNLRGAKGQDGILNPFDETDTNLYGAGGAGGYSTFSLQSVPSIPYPAPGGTTGGGFGGYGSDGSSLNKGLAGTFYGAGGGGGSFSSGHTYSLGGAGYQGIVIIYGKK